MIVTGPRVCEILGYARSRPFARAIEETIRLHSTSHMGSSGAFWKDYLTNAAAAPSVSRWSAEIVAFLRVPHSQLTVAIHYRHLLH